MTKSAKVYLSILALALAFTGSSTRAAIAYSNLPPNAPNYHLTMGSFIYGVSQDPMMTNTSSTIAMSWVPTQTGIITSLSLGLTFQAAGNGTVNVFLAENPMTLGGFDVFSSQLLLGQMTTTDQFGSTDSNLTTLATPAPLPVFAGSTYYLVLQPSDANTSVAWLANETGAKSSYFFSTDDGVDFTLAGTFDSDALQVEVIPEASTWLMGVFMTSVLALVTVRRARAKRAVVRVKR